MDAGGTALTDSHPSAQAALARDIGWLPGRDLASRQRGASGEQLHRPAGGGASPGRVAVAMPAGGSPSAVEQPAWGHGNDDLDARLANATILTGRIVGGTKRTGACEGQGMARVRALNGEGKEELFQLFERRLHQAAWSDLGVGDPLAFVVDGRSVASSGSGGVRAPLLFPPLPVPPPSAPASLLGHALLARPLRLWLRLPRTPSGGCGTEERRWGQEGGGKRGARLRCIWVAVLLQPEERGTVSFPAAFVRVGVR